MKLRAINVSTLEMKRFAQVIRVNRHFLDFDIRWKLCLHFGVSTKNAVERFQLEIFNLTLRKHSIDFGYAGHRPRDLKNKSRASRRVSTPDALRLSDKREGKWDRRGIPEPK